MTIDFICEELAELFDSPCNYSPMDEKMFQDSYCESHCGKITDKECWKRYFEKVWADRKTEPIDKDINVRSKTEPSFKVDGIGDDDSTIHAIAHLQKVGWLKEHDRALTEPQTKEWHDDCNTCRWHACTIPCCDYEPKTESQTERSE